MKKYIKKNAFLLNVLREPSVLTNDISQFVSV